MDKHCAGKQPCWCCKSCFLKGQLSSFTRQEPCETSDQKFYSVEEEILLIFQVGSSCLHNWSHEWKQNLDYFFCLWFPARISKKLPEKSQVGWSPSQKTFKISSWLRLTTSLFPFLRSELALVFWLSFVRSSSVSNFTLWTCFWFFLRETTRDDFIVDSEDGRQGTLDTNGISMSQHGCWLCIL